MYSIRLHMYMYVTSVKTNLFGVYHSRMVGDTSMVKLVLIVDGYK